MGTHREGSLSLFQVVAVVLMCRVTVGCAAVPDELEGLAGRVLQASSEIPARDTGGAARTSDSVSFVQPVEDGVVRKHFCVVIRDLHCDNRKNEMYLYYMPAMQRHWSGLTL